MHEDAVNAVRHRGNAEEDDGRELENVGSRPKKCRGANNRSLILANIAVDLVEINDREALFGTGSSKPYHLFMTAMLFSRLREG